MRAIISFVFIFMLVILALPMSSSLVYGDGTIYIRADGNVEGTAAIRRDDNVYTFTGNIYNSIIVEKSNIVIDGAGYLLRGSGSESGLYLKDINSTTIKNIHVDSFHAGIRLRNSDLIVISENELTNNQIGVYFFSATNSSIFKNDITNNDGGIVLSQTVNCTVKSNFLVANNVSIGFSNDLPNYVLENYIAQNNVGLYFGGNPPLIPASNKLIHHNTFINNTKQVEDLHWTDSYSKPSVNVWDDGATGNYWSDYDGEDADGDGIGDTPYIIDENNRDNYPLMAPLVTPQPTNFPSSAPSPEPTNSDGAEPTSSDGQSLLPWPEFELAFELFVVASIVAGALAAVAVIALVYKRHKLKK